MVCARIRSVRWVWVCVRRGHVAIRWKRKKTQNPKTLCVTLKRGMNQRNNPVAAIRRVSLETVYLLIHILLHPYMKYMSDLVLELLFMPQDRWIYFDT